MERFTALLEATPYAWYTLLAVALGGVGAMATRRAAKQRYPALFRRRRSLLILLLLLLAALVAPLSLFVPGANTLPPWRSVLLFVAPLTAVTALFFRFPRVGVPLLLLLAVFVVAGSLYAFDGYRFAPAGEPVVTVDVAAVEADSLELFLEFPGLSAERLLEEPGDPSFPVAAAGGDLLLQGELLRVHPYLWWRQPSTGLRLIAVGESGGAERFREPSCYRRRALAILELMAGAQRIPWELRRSSDELLLARYDLLLSDGEPVLRRRADSATPR